MPNASLKVVSVRSANNRPSSGIIGFDVGVSDESLVPAPAVRTMASSGRAAHASFIMTSEFAHDLTAELRRRTGDQGTSLYQACRWRHGGAVQADPQFGSVWALVRPPLMDCALVDRRPSVSGRLARSSSPLQHGKLTIQPRFAPRET
jgi:hypothetical protein